MELKSFVFQDQICVDLKGESHEEILQQLIAPLVAKKIVTDSDQFLADVIRRENDISTVMENGTAFPHARSNSVARMGLVIGMAKGDGINYSDKEKTKLFFLLAVPAFAPTAHLPLLQLLALFSMDNVRVEKFLRQKTAGMASRMISAFKAKK